VEEITATIKMKDFKLKAFILLIRLTSFISAESASKMIDWLSRNIDKFYTLKV